MEVIVITKSGKQIVIMNAIIVIKKVTIVGTTNFRIEEKRIMSAFPDNTRIRIVRSSI